MDFIKNNKTVLTSIVLIVLSFLVYLPSLENDFVWDDLVLIERSVNKFESKKISDLFFPDPEKISRMTYFRPAVVFTFIKDHELWGKDSFGFHLTNNILFSINTALVFILFLLLLKRLKINNAYLISALSSFIFMLHPVHVETVSWISGRTDLLCGFFFTLAFIFHLSSRKSTYLMPLATAAFVLSLYSKETAIAFPFVALVFDLICRRGKSESFKSLVPYFLILIFYLYARGFSVETTKLAYDFSSGLGFTYLFQTDFSLADSISKIVRAVYYYFAILILPLDMNAFIPEIPGGINYLVKSVISLFVISVCFIYSILRSWNLVSVTLAWTFLTLVPSLSVIFVSLVPTQLAERYLYIPSIGFCLLLTYLILKLINKDKLKLVSLFLFMLFIFLFGYMTMLRQGVWKDSLSLWKDSSQKSFYHALPHVNYGLALEESGRQEEAKKEYIVALNPEVKDSPRGRASSANKLALIYFNEAEDQKGLRMLYRAIDFSPYYLRTYYHFGLYYYVRAGYTKDISDYYLSFAFLHVALVKSNGRYPKANLLTGEIFTDLGNRKLAGMYAKKALRQGLEDDLIYKAEEIVKISNQSHKDNP